MLPLSVSHDPSSERSVASWHALSLVSTVEILTELCDEVLASSESLVSVVSVVSFFSLLSSLKENSIVFVSPDDTWHY